MRQLPKLFLAIYGSEVPLSPFRQSQRELGSNWVVRCKSGLYSLNLATYNLIFLNKDEFIIIIIIIQMEDNVPSFNMVYDLGEFNALDRHQNVQVSSMVPPEQYYILLSCPCLCYRQLNRHTRGVKHLIAL
jgi:hypothetical protein